MMNTFSNYLCLLTMIAMAMIGGTDCLSCLTMEKPCSQKLLGPISSLSIPAEKNVDIGCGACHEEPTSEDSCQCTESGTVDLSIPTSNTNTSTSSSFSVTTAYYHAHSVIACIPQSQWNANSGVFEMSLRDGLYAPLLPTPIYLRSSCLLI